MRINLLTASAAVLFLAGCASVEGPILEGEINKPPSSDDELRQLKEENQALKEKLAALENTNIKMPTATQIQTALKNAKFYNGEVDSKIGEKTKEAIKKFQTDNGLNPDGVVGSRTWEKLLEYLKQ